jgi:hypothetical protein
VDNSASAVEVSGMVALDDRYVQRLQVAGPGAAHIASGHRNTAPNEQFCERAHARTADTHEVHRSRIVSIQQICHGPYLDAGSGNSEAMRAAMSDAAVGFA